MGTRIGIMLGTVMLASALGGCASTLLDSAERGDLQGVRALVEGGAAINERSGLDGWTPLTGAAYGGHVAVVQFLLDHGAAPNPPGRVALSAYTTPLNAAASGGHFEVVRLLLDRGVDVNLKDDSNCTALYWAANFGHVQIVRLLLERGADCCVVGTFPTLEGTPIERAQKKGHAAIVRLLEQAQARQLGTAPPGVASPALASPSAPTLTSVPPSDVDTPLAMRAKPRSNAYAVVIGIESYREQLPKADFGAQDAKTVGTYLTRVMGYPEENVATLMNERATRTDIEKYVESWLPNRVEKDDTVFVYFSGHGAPNPKTGDAYLVPYDGDPAFVDKTGYSVKRLYEQLGKLPAKEIVVMLDSCFSGAGGRSVLAPGARPMVLAVENPLLASGKMVVLAASAGDQISSTYKQKGHGLLTYFFLKGLQGEGDQNKDGSIDLTELFAYVKPQVSRVARREFNNDQTPQLLGSPNLLSKGVRLVER